MSEFRKNWTDEKLGVVMNEWNDRNFDDESEELEGPDDNNLEVNEEA